MIVQLNGAAIHTAEEFHEAISLLLQFPDHYGRNLDALWDCITTGDHLPVTMIWKDFALSRERLGDYADAITQVFEDASEVRDVNFRVIQA